MKIISADISGSLIVNGQNVTTTIQTSNTWSGSAASSITALNATTASLLSYTASNNAAITDILFETASLNATTASLLSYTASQNSRNGTYATTGSNTFAGIQTVNSNLVVTGSITAATLIVQTVTSSISFITGSTRFGSLPINTHQFTGSVIVTGSLNATTFSGSGANLTSIPNAALTNSTISGIALGSNLATLTIGTGLSGTSYNGSGAVTIANTGVTSNVAGTGITVSGATGAVTISIGQSVATSATPTFAGLTVNTSGTGTWGPFVVTSTSQWGDGATQYVTIGAGGAAGIMINNPHVVWNTSEVAAGIKFGRSGGTSAGSYYVIGTGASNNFFINKDGAISSPVLNINSSGNATFSGTLTASNLSGTNTGDQTNISGNAATATSATSATTATNVASPDGDRNPSTKLPTTNARNVRFDFSGAGAVGGAGNYAGVMTYAPWDGTSASTGDSSYQLAFLNETGVNASGNPGLSLRNGINSTWNGWHRIVTSANIASYTAGNVNSISSAVGGAYTWTGINYFQSNRNTSSDSPMLQAFSNNASGAIMAFHRGGYYAINFGLDSDNVMRMGGWSASTNRFQMDMSGNLTMAGDVTAYSDARVKENIKTIENALSKTLALRGVSYNRTDSEDKKTKIGVIAQETLPIIPEVVNQDNDGMYNVSYGNLAGLFIEAIKEQQTQIEELKSIINGLTK
jgi:hypothetical protein